jgi:hypothetical protein
MGWIQVSQNLEVIFHPLPETVICSRYGASWLVTLIGLGNWIAWNAFSCSVLSASWAQLKLGFVLLHHYVSTNSLTVWSVRSTTLSAFQLVGDNCRGSGYTNNSLQVGMSAVNVAVVLAFPFDRLWCVMSVVLVFHIAIQIRVRVADVSVCRTLGYIMQRGWSPAGLSRFIFSYTEC